MADYLTRLAKRTFGLLPVAQPLITPSFSSFNPKMNDRTEISFIENGALFDQQVIPGTREKEIPQVSKPRSKVQNTAQSRHELSSGKAEHSVPGDANNSLLTHKKITADIRDQRHPETNFISRDAISITQPVHIEKQVPTKDTGIEPEKNYDEQESVTLSDRMPKYQKNSGHRRNPDMMGPDIEKEMMGTGIEKEMTGSMTGKETKEIDIADPISVSKIISDPFSEKYGEGHLLPVLNSGFKTKSQQGIDIFSQDHNNTKSTLIRQSNLKKKTNPDSSGDNPDYPVKSDNLHEPGKLISSDPPSGRVASFSEIDRSIVRNQQHNEMNRKTGFKNVIDPVIKISREGKEQIIRDIQTKKQQPSIPTIKVTIGRVEVRAVPPQPAFSPSPAMKKPALSLDEYLKQHNG